MGAVGGIRVVDLSRPGPDCGMLLVDMGADVVRVDGAPLAGPDEYLYGETLGRGKWSVGLDRKHPEAREAALRLVDRTDVLIKRFRLGAMERLGWPPMSSWRATGALVFARVTGRGEDGPLGDCGGGGMWPTPECCMRLSVRCSGEAANHPGDGRTRLRRLRRPPCGDRNGFASAVSG